MSKAVPGIVAKTACCFRKSAQKVGICMAFRSAKSLCLFAKYTPLIVGRIQNEGIARTGHDGDTPCLRPIVPKYHHVGWRSFARGNYVHAGARIALRFIDMAPTGSSVMAGARPLGFLATQT